MRRRLCPAILILLIALLCAPLALAEDVESWNREHPEILRNEHLFSEAAVLIDGDTGELLFNKNAHVRMYPASTTKIMTLLLALESGISLNEVVTIPDVAGDIPEGSSIIPVYPGEQMPFRDLLYGFMLKSGNDGANAIAVLVSGSIPDFVERMNARAAELGCVDTHFVNAHGYHNQEHYSTAADLAVIAMEAMRNADFRQIVAAPKYTMSATSRRGELEIVSRNEIINPDSKYYYPDAVGIKTGFHSKAGQCLVGGAVRGGKLLISVTLNSDGQDETLKWYDTARLFEYGFTCYEQKTFGELAASLPEGLTEIRVDGAAESDPRQGWVSLVPADISGAEAQISVRRADGAVQAEMRRLWEGANVTYADDIAAPISQGQRLGSFTLALPNGQEVSGAMIATRAVEAHVEPTATPVSTVPAVTTPAPTGAQMNGDGLRKLELILLSIGLISLAAVVLLIVQQARERTRRKQRRSKRASTGAASGKGKRS